MFIESSLRSVLKAVSHRITNTSATILIFYLFTEEWSIALKAGATEVLVKFIWFYVHERLWNRITFGKKRWRPFVLWFTGLPFSGKSLLADSVFVVLKKRGIQIQRLDGDDVKTLFPAQGFTREERNIYLKRMGYFASILEKNQVTVIASFISPFEESREYNRKITQGYIQVHVATPLEECRKRDEWGLFQKAANGELKHFIGVHEKYEKPQTSEIVVDLAVTSEREATKKILKYLNRRFFL